MSWERLQSLLEESQSYGPEFGNGLSNHLPMCLVALQQMDATGERLTEFYQHYIPRLNGFERATEATDPLKSLNQPELFPAHLNYFNQLIEKQGVAETLKTWIPHLLSGMGTGAFHALLRVGYSIKAENPHETAQGLAYWTSSYLDLGSDAEQVDSEPGDFLTIIDQTADIARDHTFTPGIIFNRMAEIAAMPTFRDLPIQPATVNLEGLAELALTAYVNSRNFTLLHGVTGCHALRLLLPFVDDQEALLRAYWRALLTAYLSTGSVPIDQKIELDYVLEWPTLLEQAVASNNDHVIKMIYTCWREEQQYHNPAYLYAANLALG